MEWISGNIFIRPAFEHVDAGAVLKGHRHAFDHTTIVFSGAVHIKGTLPNGTVIEQDFHAPAHCLILANVEHEITALADDTTLWCVYSHRTPQGDVTQQWTGWHRATT